MSIAGHMVVIAQRVVDGEPQPPEVFSSEVVCLIWARQQAGETIIWSRRIDEPTLGAQH